MLEVSKLIQDILTLNLCTFPYFPYFTLVLVSWCLLLFFFFLVCLFLIFMFLKLQYFCIYFNLSYRYTFTITLNFNKVGRQRLSKNYFLMVCDLQFLSTRNQRPFSAQQVVLNIFHAKILLKMEPQKYTCKRKAYLGISFPYTEFGKSPVYFLTVLKVQRPINFRVWFCCTSCLLCSSKDCSKHSTSKGDRLLISTLIFNTYVC